MYKLDSNDTLVESLIVHQVKRLQSYTLFSIQCQRLWHWDKMSKFAVLVALQ